jgi:hypothetical protein
VVNSSVSGSLGKFVRDLYEEADTVKRDTLIRAAKLHSIAYFEKFYPWSEFFGIQYDHAALEAMTTLSERSINGWELLEASVLSSRDLRLAWNIAFYADVLRYRKLLRGAARDFAQKLFDALTQSDGHRAFLQIRELITDNADRISGLPWAPEIFGGWVEGFRSKEARAKWVNLETKRASTNVGQIRLLRNQVAHRGTLQAPGQAAMAHFLNSRVGNIWCACAAGATPDDIIEARDEIKSSGEVSTDQLLRKIGAAFNRHG